MMRGMLACLTLLELTYRSQWESPYEDSEEAPVGLPPSLGVLAGIAMVTRERAEAAAGKALQDYYTALTQAVQAPQAPLEVDPLTELPREMHDIETFNADFAALHAAREQATQAMRQARQAKFASIALANRAAMERGIEEGSEQVFQTLRSVGTTIRNFLARSLDPDEKLGRLSLAALTRRLQLEEEKPPEREEDAEGTTSWDGMECLVDPVETAVEDGSARSASLSVARSAARDHVVFTAL